MKVYSHLKISGHNVRENVHINNNLLLRPLAIKRKQAPNSAHNMSIFYIICLTLGFQCQLGLIRKRGQRSRILLGKALS